MTHHDVLCSIGGVGTRSLLAILSHRRWFLRCRTTMPPSRRATRGQARVSQSPSRTKPCNAKVRRPYLRASTTARRTHRWRKLRRIDHWDCISLAAYGPKQTRLVLLFADEPQDRRLVFLDAWITPDARVNEKIVVEVIVRRGDLPNDTLV